MMGDQQLTRQDALVAASLCTLGAVLGFFSPIYAVAVMVSLSLFVKAYVVVPADKDAASWFLHLLGPNWGSLRRTWWLCRAPWLAAAAGILVRILYRLTVSGAE
ncbi:MAG: hypothetical protein ACRCS3_03520 [Paracoccaceae bacterium]